MNELMPVFSHLSAAATGALVSAVWQGALLATLVYVCLRFFPALSAAARSIIWLNVFILLALLHVLPFLTGGAVMPRAASVHAVHLDPRWSFAVAVLWLALSVGRAVQLLLGAVHLRKIARRATAVATDDDLQQLLSGIPGRPVVQLCASDEVARPSVLGFFRPRILIPPALLRDLSAKELHQVVLHELEHLRRADDWTNLLQKIALVFFPLNPALLWVERRLCAERELACDDRVVRSGSGRKAYALCLTHLAEYALVRRGFSLVLGAWERRPELVRRVQRILAQPGRSMGRRPALAATGALIASAFGCTFTLAHAPQLVSFTPAPQVQQARMLAQPDLAELSRELGGTPQLARAVMASPKEDQPHPMKAVAKVRTARHHPPAARLADLRTPASAQGTYIVLTQWTQSSSASQVFVAEWSEFTPQPRATAPVAHAQSTPSKPVLRPAYAVVPTPEGWLILQI